MLDDARLTAANNPNRIISFTGNIIFITTNLASEVYQHNKKFANADEEIDIEVIYKALADDERFETAVLGRLDDIVPFMSLPEDAMAKIAQRELDTNLDVVRTNKRRILVSPNIIPHIVKDRTSQDSERGGARDAKRNVKSLVLQKIAHYLADDPEERPIILYLQGKARYLHKSVVDPFSADVAIKECHPQATVDYWLKQLRTKLNVNIIDKGIFVPIDWTSEYFARAIVAQTHKGIRMLKTHVNEEEIWIGPA